MNENYIIIWVAKKQNLAGIGKRLMSKEEADALSADLNSDYPAFLHLAINSEMEQPSTRLRALRESLAQAGANAVRLAGPASMEAAQAEPDGWAADAVADDPLALFGRALAA